MTDIRFIRNDGQRIAVAIVRKRFFELAADAEFSPFIANKIWHDALVGDADARELIEDLCGIDIVDADTGFGFVE